MKKGLAALLILLGKLCVATDGHSRRRGTNTCSGRGKTSRSGAGSA